MSAIASIGLVDFSLESIRARNPAIYDLVKQTYDPASDGWLSAIGKLMQTDNVALHLDACEAFAGAILDVYGVTHAQLATNGWPKGPNTSDALQLLTAVQSCRNHVNGTARPAVVRKLAKLLGTKEPTSVQRRAEMIRAAILIGRFTERIFVRTRTNDIAVGTSVSRGRRKGHLKAAEESAKQRLRALELFREYTVMENLPIGAAQRRIARELGCHEVTVKRYTSPRFRKIE